ncbi:Anoctamin-7 [Labeo rohita]|uniref:Anoctamin n=1 Tax=Labeo rohita TaxID=84645 RepID=A0ABQ8M112_LABRO|nr:Anoctamin-7 [Labeo rohita]
MRKGGFQGVLGSLESAKVSENRGNLVVLWLDLANAYGWIPCRIVKLALQCHNVSGHENKDTFFKTTQRHQILYEILARTPYGSLKRGEVGVGRLVSENVLTAAFPLHEGPFEIPKTPGDPQSLNMRQILHHYWARWACWKKYQPLDHIREYFGEKIALYFAWLGFYTGWLLPAAVVGFIVFLFGIWLMVTDVAAEELCSSGDIFVMCPLCNICSYWNLSSICYTYKAGLLFDNGGTVFFSIFMSLWAVTFLEYWKRTCSILSHRWDCSEFEEIEERPRPEFTALAPMTVRNPVTGAEEPYFPETQRLSRTLTGNMVIILMAGRIASLTGSMLNLLVILLLSRLYTYLAQILTRWEMHRTQTKYEDAFILKVFIFQFVNFYSSPVYIAFFKGRFVGYPGNYNTLLGIRNEDVFVSRRVALKGNPIDRFHPHLLAPENSVYCGQADIINALKVDIIGNDFVSDLPESDEVVLTNYIHNEGFLCRCKYGNPPTSIKLKTWWNRRKLKPAPSQEMIDEPNSNPELSPWEANYQLLVCEGLFDEYLEMVLQFGFITIFVAACPLAPLFALINNWVEVRLDAQKFVCEYRRPVVERAQDIGIWLTILNFISYLAVISNAFLISFTSDFLPRLFYRYTTGSMRGYINFTLSHVVLLIGRVIDWMVPDIPEEVEIKIKREHYMAKEALAENQSLSKTVLGDMERQISELRQRGRIQSPMNNSLSPSSPPPEHEDKPTV